MKESDSSSRRIAKNTIALYIRMFISMIVGLYTSRIVLSKLGVEDYGIYGVVSGVVAMFGFLNASMSGATTRFITFELGRKDYTRLKDTFSSAMIIHIGIAIIVLVIAETLGLWFLNNKLVIPPDRIDAARWVFQCSLLSVILGIIQVPYNATIIAHERMGIFAYIEIINVTLKLIIVYLLTIGNFDKLILYALLLTTVSLITLMIYQIYDIHNFSESRFSCKCDKKILRNIFSYISWEMYGNICITLRDYGANTLVNIFFNVIYNAAISLATTINGVISAFSYNIVTAFRPRIIKSFSTQDFGKLQSYINQAITYSCLVFIAVSVPCLLETETLINAWLGTLPLHLITFVHIILIINFIKVINTIILVGIQATGNIRNYSLITGTIFLLTIPATYILLKNGFAAEYSYITVLSSVTLVLIISTYLLKRVIKEIQILPIIKSLVNICIICAISFGIAFVPHILIDNSYLRLFCVTVLSIIAICTLTYIIILDNHQREKLLNLIVFSKKNL